GTSGIDTLAGWPPSNVSDNVALSPSAMVSRSNDAVKLAARAKTGVPSHKNTARQNEITRRSRNRRKCFAQGEYWRAAKGKPGDPLLISVCIWPLSIHSTKRHFLH